MKSIHSLKYLLIPILSVCLSVAQADSIYQNYSDSLPHLYELELALFPPEDSYIPVYNHPACVFKVRAWDRYGHLEVDSSVMVRATQPDKGRVNTLLLQIAQSRDYRYFDPLMHMYERHQAYFKSEWEYIIVNNESGCDIASQSIQIMHAFEHALYSLELAEKNLSNEELESLYFGHIRNRLEYLYGGPSDQPYRWQFKKKIDDQIHYYSDYFKKVRSMHYKWNAYPISFGFYTVFLEELEDYIVKKVLAVDANSFDKLPREDFEEYFKSQEVLFHISAMKKRKSRNFEIVLQTVFDELTRSGYIVRVFEYVRGNKEVSSEFIEFLLDQIYTHEHFKHDLEVQETFTGILGFMLNTHTRPVIKEYLMERAKAANSDHRLLSWSYLVYFSNEPDVLQLMLDKSKQKNLSLEERKVLTNNFQRMLKAEDFPEEEKERVRMALKKMTKGKKK